METSSLSAFERFNCVKVFFQPSFSSKDANGVHDSSFMKCGVDIRKELCAYVVFSSGTTMFQWIFEHITKEPTALAPSSRTTSIIIVDGAERFCCMKVFVQQSSSGKEASGFHGISFFNIMKCYVNFRKELYGNAVLPSGKTLRLKCFGT